MKTFSVLILLATLSTPAFANSVTGHSTEVNHADPYSELSPSLIPGLIHDAKVAAFLNAITQCGSETVRRTTDYKTTQNIQRPECVPYHDGCNFDEDTVVTVTASASFDCLSGPKPDFN